VAPKAQKFIDVLTIFSGVCCVRDQHQSKSTFSSSAVGVGVGVVIVISLSISIPVPVLSAENESIING